MDIEIIDLAEDEEDDFDEAQLELAIQNSIRNHEEQKRIIQEDDFDEAQLELAIQNSIRDHEEQKRLNQNNNFNTAGPSGYKPNTLSNTKYDSNSNENDNTGFDATSGDSWIYPVNFQVRDYQFNIVQKGLYKNILVCLPTGLGKTFVAAVIMYNFYRWFPNGKIVFMAPTKPLVNQQIQACFKIMGIPQNEMVEMTGTTHWTERKSSWNSKRMFFLTPQVMANDLNRGICAADRVRCLVIDEAHRALGNHAYVVVVKELLNYTKDFRVVALSATPGSDRKAVQQVISNLLISAVEIRTEESLDVRAYVHDRAVEKVIVPLSDEISNVRKIFLQIIDTNIKRLSNKGVLWNANPESLSQYALIKERDRFRQNPPDRLPRADFSFVESQFALCTSLYHCLELLQMHGLTSFYNFIQGIMDGQKSQPFTRRELMKDFHFMQMFEELKAKLDPVLNQGKTHVAGHPKMEKLVEIVIAHFNKFKNEEVESECDVSTRVMIFAQYRDTVDEITTLLNQHGPLVKAMSFIGQSSKNGVGGKGLTQKLQQQIVARFRNGQYNTLVSTCVGEEGLDIGDVDLIICYDAHKSPVRLVQRMGRTGRKRQGRIVMLITKGKEERIYNQGQSNKKNINRAVANCSREYSLYEQNRRLVPRGTSPVCRKVLLTSEEFQTKNNKRTAESVSGAAKAVKKMKTTEGSSLLSESEIVDWSRRFKLANKDYFRFDPGCEMLSLKSRNDDVLIRNKSDKTLSVSNWTSWQASFQHSYLVSHTSKCSLMVKTIQQLQTSQHMHNNSGVEAKKSPAKRFISDFFTVISKSPNKSVDIPRRDCSVEPEETEDGPLSFFRYPTSVLESATRKKEKESPQPSQLSSEEVDALKNWLKSVVFSINDDIELETDSDEDFLKVDLGQIKSTNNEDVKMEASNSCYATETLCGMTQLLDLVAQESPKTPTIIEVNENEKSKSIKSIFIHSSPKSNFEVPNFEFKYEDDSDDDLFIIPPSPEKPSRSLFSFKQRDNRLESAGISPIRVQSNVKKVSPEVSLPSHSTPTMPPPRVPDQKSPKTTGNQCFEQDSPIGVNKKMKRKKLDGKLYILSQAEVSGSESSDDEEDFIEKIDDWSFVDDDSLFLTATQMGVYMESVKNPVNPTRAYTTEPVNNRDLDVPFEDFLSQTLSSEASTYKEDSFCVANDHLEFETPKQDAKKWKRIKLADDDSTSDEMDTTLTSVPAAAAAASSTATKQQANSTCLKATEEAESKKSEVNILVSSREVSAAGMIISNLKFKHGVKVHVCQISNCDYIVSNRAAVKRKAISDVANSSAAQKLLLSLKEMAAVYEKPYLLIEDDRSNGKTTPRPMLYTFFYDSVLVKISNSPTTVLFSYSKEETASVLVSVGESEFKRGFGFKGPFEAAPSKQSAFNIYSSLPTLSICAALNLTHNFNSLQEFINSCCEEKMQKGQISRSKAELIEKFVSHRFSSFHSGDKKRL